MATVDVKYDTTPHDGTPGPPWDDFEERILGVAAGRTDDRGWSLADCANQTDEGGVGGPPMPAAGAAAAKAQTARRGCPIPESQICRGRGSGAADLGAAPGSGDRGYGWGCLYEPAPMYACKKNI